MKLIQIIICTCCLFACSQSTLKVVSFRSEISSDVNTEIKLTILLKSEKTLKLSMHEASHEAFLLFSSDTSCDKEIRGMPIQAPISKLKDIQISKSKQFKVELKGYLSRLKTSQVYLLDFGKLGKICSQVGSNTIKFKVGFIPITTWSSSNYIDSDLKMTELITVQVTDKGRKLGKKR